MAKKPNQKKQQPKEFDIHRSLPNRQRRSTHPRGSKGYEVVDNALLDEEIALKGAEKPKKRITWKRLLALILLIPICFLLFIGIWDARNFSHASEKMFGSSNLLDLISVGGLKTDSNDRVNVLIVGNSADDPGHSGANLTDSIMILSMSTKTHTGYMLSIPRDLYVKIPGYGYGKINSAYTYGGIDLLKEIISDDLDLQIGYYTIVDYASVRDVVDALGGITVNIQSPDPKGLYDPSLDYTSLTCCALANYPNGPVTLNGKQALNLTRARGDSYGSYGFPRSDYNRTEHQRQIFAAIKARLNWKLVLDPRTNEKVFNAFANNIKTDVELAEVRPLYAMFHKIPDSSMQSIGLDKINNTVLISGSNIDGISVQVPSAGFNNYSQIVEALNTLNSQ